MANTLTQAGTALTGAVAVDPNLCRISGFLKNLSGEVLKGWRFSIRHIHEPYVVGSTDLVLQENIPVTSDANGLVSFDLLQGATVRVEITGRILDFVLEALVPEAASADLIDFLFPYIVSVAWDDGASVAVAEGETITLGVTATLSNGDTLELLNGTLTSTPSDSEALVATVGTTYTAETAGSYTVSLDDVDTDSVTIYQEPSGDVIGRLDTPAITFPSDIAVVVT